MCFRSFLKQLCQPKSIVCDLREVSNQRSPAGCRIHVAVTLVTTVVNQPIPFFDKRVQGLDWKLGRIACRLYSPKQAAKSLRMGVSKHCLHLGSRLVWSRLMHEDEIGADRSFGDLRLPEREADHSGNFVELLF